jgi:prepilin-type N-terminal cleavage/methylation domain-containing protein
MSTDRIDEHGFTLIELLVVMIVIGALASIAIPVMLSQRARAHDASTKADVSNLGKEVASYFVDGRGTLVLNFSSTPGKVVLSDGAGYSASVNLTNGTAQPTAGGSARLDDPSDWCVALVDTAGRDQSYTYSARDGLGLGTCS